MFISLPNCVALGANSLGMTEATARVASFLSKHRVRCDDVSKYCAKRENSSQHAQSPP